MEKEKPDYRAAVLKLALYFFACTIFLGSILVMFGAQGCKSAKPIHHCRFDKKPTVNKIYNRNADRFSYEYWHGVDDCKLNCER